jgi:prophage maintenance system killer protein
VLFLDLNDRTWTGGGPDVDEAVEAVLAVARRDVDEAWLAAWLRGRITPAS